MDLAGWPSTSGRFVRNLQTSLATRLETEQTRSTVDCIVACCSTVQTRIVVPWYYTVHKVVDACEQLFSLRTP